MVSKKTGFEALGITEDQAMVNVLALYAEATSQQRTDGRTWYARASDLAAILAGRFNVSYEIAAGVLAAVSPQAPWLWSESNKQCNVYRAIEVLSAGSDPDLARPHKTCMMTADWNRARPIALGHYSDPINGLGKMSFKIKAFYQSIRDRGESEPVAIDSHMINLAVNRRTNDKEKVSIFCNGERYSDLARLIAECALAVGESPQKMQAVLWVCWREKMAR